MKPIRRLALALLLVVVFGVVTWALIHWRGSRRNGSPQSANVNAPELQVSDAQLWSRAVDAVKADRGEPVGGGARVDVPPELRHYSDTHWFLATQIAEVHKHNLRTCEDFVDVAVLIQQHELINMPAVTNDYVLFGVGARVDDSPFQRYENNENLELYDEAQLSDAYQRLQTRHSSLQSEISASESQLTRAKSRDRARQKELQKQIAAAQNELAANEKRKALLDQFYGQPEVRRQRFKDYDSLKELAKNFGGRYYHIEEPTDRQALKLQMLQSLRPVALKILQEIAANYRQQFGRPLAVSSLMRPEQYQQALHKVNRNAVIIETPPHSTGLAFDIDYRYMSAAEQSFLMTLLARMKDEGRIEVLRERKANYHVFVFIDGVRPSDDLIAACLVEAGEQPEDENQADSKKPTPGDKSKEAKSSRPRKNVKR